MHVRSSRPEDAPALARIFHAAVHQIGSLHYSMEQLNAWAPVLPSPERFYERGTDGRLLLVAVDTSDQSVAYGDLEADGHIDHFYCRPDFAGTGVTSTLCDGLEAAAKDRGISRLYASLVMPCSGRSSARCSRPAPRCRPTKEFRLKQTMLRVRDPDASLAFYTEMLGISLLQRLDFEVMRFTLFFLAFLREDEEVPEDLAERARFVFFRKRTLELTITGH